MFTPLSVDIQLVRLHNSRVRYWRSGPSGCGFQSESVPWHTTRTTRECGSHSAKSAPPPHHPRQKQTMKQPTQLSHAIKDASYLFQMHHRFNGEKDGEPGKHPRRMSSRVNGKCHIFVQHRLEITGETVQNGIAIYGETASSIPTIIHNNICKRN